MNTNHLIWSKVQIFFCGCKRFKHPGRGNLFLTKELHLENTWYKNLHPNKYYHHKCSACTRMNDDGDIKLTERARFISEVELFRILGACNPKMVHSVLLENVSIEGIHRTLDVLTFVTKLEIDVVPCDWQCIIALPNLQTLSVQLNETNPSENDGFRQLLSENKLNSLYIYSPINTEVLEWMSVCDSLTKLFLMQTNDVQLEPLGMLRNLKVLHLQRGWQTQTTRISVKPLASLKSLTSLELNG